MSVGKNHTITVKPTRVLRVEFKVTGVERGGYFSHAERYPLMTLLGFHNGIDR